MNSSYYQWYYQLEIYTLEIHKYWIFYKYVKMSWQYDTDKMSMTKSHGGILVNVIYQLNKLTTFIQTKYE